MPVKIGATELADADVAAFKEVFDMVDQDGGGSISAAEVAQLMQMLGMETSMQDVEAMVAEIDVDGNGVIDFNEFLHVMAGTQQPTYTKRELLRAFRLFADKDAPPGHISVGALEKALATYCGDRLAEDEAARLIAQLAVRHDGLISYHDAVSLFLSR